MPSERALLVTIQLDHRFTPYGAVWPMEDEATELRELAIATGCSVLSEFTARRHRPVAGTFLGKGKLDEIARAVEEHQVQVVIFNQELSSAQQRNIESIVGVKTIDRTQLILDIFSRRAKSREGKVQVELAQLRYMLPRLVGEGIVLSRLGGGIGTRGPGEQKLEVDRRRIRTRISRLKGELDKLSSRRRAMRSRRKETQVPVVALIGYTNAGKTTLLNRCTGEISTAKNQLFTTLDPLVRKLRLPNGQNVVLTDTVGFLHHLPHHLIEAFKATLEEAQDADLLLQVMDVSHPLIEQHAQAVDEVLKMLNLMDKPRITILNKRDLIENPIRVASLERVYQPAVSISAKNGDGLKELLMGITEHLKLFLDEVSLLQIPVDKAEVLSSIYRFGQVLEQDEIKGFFQLKVRLPQHLRASLSEYITS